MIGAASAGAEPAGDLPRQRDRAGADDHQRPRRHALRHSLPGVRPGGVRPARRARPSLLRAVVACGWFGIQTWVGGLAITRWSALPGRAGPALGGGWRFMGSRRRRVRRLRRVLGDQPLVRLGRHREHQVAGDGVGAVPHRDLRAGAAVVGDVGGLGVIVEQSAALTAADGPRRAAARRSLAVVPAVAHRDGGLLGHPLAQHPRLHPLRAEPDRPGGRPGARAAHHDAALRVHRHRGHQRHGAALRRGDLEPGGPAWRG